MNKIKNTKDAKEKKTDSKNQSPSVGVEPNVYARHGHELMGFKSPVSEPLYFMFFKVQQLLAKGNCGAARHRGKEARSKAVSRRTETS